MVGMILVLISVISMLVGMRSFGCVFVCFLFEFMCICIIIFFYKRIDDIGYFFVVFKMLKVNIGICYLMFFGKILFCY